MNKITINYRGNVRVDSGKSESRTWSDREFNSSMGVSATDKILGFHASAIFIDGKPIETYIKDHESVSKDCEQLERDIETFMDAVMENKSLDGSKLKSRMVRKLAHDVRERIGRERREAAGNAFEAYKIPDEFTVGSMKVSGSIMTMSDHFPEAEPIPAPTLKELAREYAEALISEAMKRVIEEITAGSKAK